MQNSASNTEIDKIEQNLNDAAKTGDLEAIKLCYKLHKHTLDAKLFSSAASWAILKKHFHCVKYLIDLAWHTFSNEDKCFVLKMAALTASENSQTPEIIRENTKSLAYFLKKYKPTFPEGTFLQLKKDYCTAFENLQSPHAQKANESFLPMFKNTTAKTIPTKPSNVVVRKPLAMVNLLEDPVPNLSRKLKTF